MLSGNSYKAYKSIQSLHLSCTKDIIVKEADKGGALVVWRPDLYQKEALRQLSDTSFYAKVEKDLTSTNQQICREHLCSSESDKISSLLVFFISTKNLHIKSVTLIPSRLFFYVKVKIYTSSLLHCYQLPIFLTKLHIC